MQKSGFKIPSSAELVSQGAEAKVYQAYLQKSSGNKLDIQPVLLKHRFSKQYRHPALDKTLTKQRVRFVDLEGGTLGLEWIDGITVRKIFGGGDNNDGDEEDSYSEHVIDGQTNIVSSMEEERNTNATAVEALLHDYGLSQEQLMHLIGKQVAKLHGADIIHGDLTTSNMMIRRVSQDPLQSELVLLDFGLTHNSLGAEDKAVDLYVLERAFSSTHPDSEPLFSAVLEGYTKEMGKGWPSISKKLDDVRLRGRKRSMVG